MVDVCVKCEELNTKIKSNVLNDSAKRVAVAKIVVQKRKAKKFYSNLGSVTKTCQNGTKTFGICTDFIANVSFTCIPVQDIYYFRQLTVDVFAVHDLVIQKMTSFVYHGWKRCK